MPKILFDSSAGYFSRSGRIKGKRFVLLWSGKHYKDFPLVTRTDFVSTIAHIFSQPLNSIGSTGVRQLILVRLEVRAKLDFVSTEMTTGHL